MVPPNGLFFLSWQVSKKRGVLGQVSSAKYGRPKVDPDADPQLAYRINGSWSSGRE